MASSASRPVRSARAALRPALAAAIGSASLVATLVAGAFAAPSAAAPDTSALHRAPPPASAGFQSAAWETVATVPEATHLAPIFNVRYNRVDGVALTAGGAIVTGEDELRLLYGQFTYAFASERGLWTVGFTAPLGDRRLFILEGKVYRRTWNWDQWIVGETENTIFGLVAETDYRDYWAAKGAEASVSWNPGTDFELSVSGRSEQQTQLDTQASFAVFQKTDGFRPNPRILEGKQGVIVATMQIGPGDLQPGVGASPLALGLLPANEVASNLVVSYARAGDPLDADFRYSMLTLQMHARIKPATTHEGRVRLIAASTLSGALPPQQVLSLGGIGTLRGFDYKSIEGDQSFLANGEYYVMVRKNVYGFAFLDFGDSWYGRDNLPRIQPALDGGLGIRLGQGPIAVTAARSLQSSTAPILIGVRLGGSF